jgi:hypothetical protein
MTNTLIMEAANTAKMPKAFTRPHSTTAQKEVVFDVLRLRSQAVTEMSQILLEESSAVELHYI